MPADALPDDPLKLRDLASWYREFADRAGNSWIWAARLRTAEDLETQADLIENGQPAQKSRGDSK